MHESLFNTKHMREKTFMDKKKHSLKVYKFLLRIFQSIYVFWHKIYSIKRFLLQLTINSKYVFLK